MTAGGLHGCAAPITFTVAPAGGERGYCLSGDCYRLGHLDDGWRLVRQAGGQLGFFHAGRGAVIQSNAACRDDIEAAPLVSLTNHLLVGYTARHVRSSALVALAEREARRTVVDARLDGVPLVLDLYVLRRNGCVFDLSLVAPPSAYEGCRAEFERFVAGFSPLSALGSVSRR